MNYFSFWKVALATALCAVVFSVTTDTAHAQVIADGLQAVGDTIRLSSQDPRIIAASIINVVLGFLGIIFLGLTVYAGFLWMTSGGSEDKTAQAKTLLKNAVIGLAIILSSWAITRFVLSRLLDATNVNGGVSGTSDGGGGFGGGFGGGGDSLFQVISITPSGSVPIRNVRVRFIFTRPVDVTSVASAVRVVRADSQAPVDGAFTTSGSIVEFTPSAPCPGGLTGCFDADTEFRAIVSPSLRSLAVAGQLPQTIVCGGLAPVCDATFQTGNLVDSVGPSVSITSPFDGQSVPVDDGVLVTSRAVDDIAISYVSSSVDGRLLGIVSPATSSRELVATLSWSTRGVATGTHALMSSTADLDSHEAVSPVVRAQVRPQHCFNGVRDQDEEAIDCGGSSCGLCSGGTCTQGSQCRGGICSGQGVCVEQPVITGVGPLDGKPGTLVTITGANFGRTAGEVYFWGGNGFTVRANAPAACLTGAWSDSQVIVEVPTGAQTGPVQVRNTVSALNDATNDTNGPAIPDYTVNTVARPGLCAVEPTYGERGDTFTLRGVGLGTVSGRVLFATQDVTPSSFAAPWADTSVSMQVPVVGAATYPVKVRVGGVDSNAVAFRVIEQARGTPTITSLDPAAGPVGQYVTVVGRNFGTTPGRVVFVNTRTQESGTADVRFPAACTQEYWRDSAITVKVPETVGLSTPVTPGDFRVYVVRNADAQESNRSAFSVNTTPLAPGVCAVNPVAGPAGTVVTIAGERFGSTRDEASFQGDGETRVVASSITSWADGAVAATVPSGGRSGLVRVSVGGRTSNGAYFGVQNCNENTSMCGTETCCRDSGQCSVRGVCAAVSSATPSMFAWQMSTGKLPLYPDVIEECSQGTGALPPSPSPWNRRQGGAEVCVNAQVAMRFTTSIDTSTITASNIVVSRCVADSGNECARKEVVTGRVEHAIADADPTRRRTLVTFVPDSGTWTPDTLFDVSVRTGIRSEAGIAMRERADECGNGIGYCFRFRTRVSTEPCRLGNVLVTPSQYTASDLADRIGYLGNAVSAEDSCVQINPATLDWQWYTGTAVSRPDGRASLLPYTQQSCPPSGCAYRRTGRPESETGPNDPVRVNAQASNPGDVPRTGTGLLSVQFIPPRVVAHGPDCDEACIEGKLWAEFNVPLDPAYATERQVLVYKCVNENCRAFDPPTPYELPSGSVSLSSSRQSGAPNRLMEILPVRRTSSGNVSFLEPGAFYKVIVLGDRTETGTAGVRSSMGRRMTEFNDAQGFAWRFRVRTDNRGQCEPTRVDIRPLEKIEDVVGARTLFSADPIFVSDVCGEQYLMASDSFAWSTERPRVSRFINARGAGLVDTSTNLPANCSGRCTNMGAQGVDGRVAICNNNVLETTDPLACRLRSAPSTCTPGAPGCACTTASTDCVSFRDASQRCRLLEQGSQGSEECDLGDRNGTTGSACSNRCLWTGTEAPTCGNSVLEAGEQCDPGRACVAGANAGRVCTTNSDCPSSTCGVNTRDTGCSERCLALGSTSVVTPGEESMCGNGSVGAGEMCDDGNRVDGDGCSSQCLHEGSRQILAICGNGALEPGESCEATRASDGSLTWPARCDRATCLNLGTQACTAQTPSGAVCCGNGTQEAGEDCDDGNSRAGDGCSQVCKAEGSSITYTTPSFCGDGILSTGEQCEAPAGDGRIDGKQLSEIVGEEDADSSGRMTSRLTAAYRERSGQATHGLQCGYTEEAQCINTESTPPRTLNSHGLTTGGCCMMRPQVTNRRTPAPGATGVCRNIEISFEMNQRMDEASVRENVVIAQEAAVCPSGTTPLDEYTQARRVSGVTSWTQRIGYDLLRRLGTTAFADTQLCVGSAPGTVTVENGDNNSTITFSLNRALDPNKVYHVVVLGDNDLADDRRVGARNSNGVLMAGNTQWSFTTGAAICTANQIEIRDRNEDSPFLFTSPREQHQYNGKVQSVQAGVAVPISSVQEYGWDWRPWISSETTVLTASATTERDVLARSSTSTISALNKNGQSFISAGIQIRRDDVNTPSTVGTNYETARTSHVVLCERPWPQADVRYGATTFSDSDPKDTREFHILRGSIFQDGPFYNFATAYCMDFATTSTEDDLPQLTVNFVPPSPTDASRQILRQYLLSFDDGGSAPARFRADAIGVRVIANPLHLSVASWYQSQGFTGNPQPTTVDGYEALQEGTTLYVSAPNTDNTGTGSVYSNIYIFSYNEGAQPETINIFNQLKDNLTLNVNLQQSNMNVCTSGSAIALENNNAIPCRADWECMAKGEAYRCSSFKSKIQRDIQRFADVQNVADRLDTYAASHQETYPIVSSGSFLPGMTNSRWGSWQSVLGTALQTQLPTDPVNRYMTCGRCQYAGQAQLGEACGDSSECREGGTCVSAPIGEGAAAMSYDPATCWNQDRQRFICPRLATDAPSRVYQYRSIDAGAGYELGVELEGPQYDRYAPPLLTQAGSCSNTGAYCEENSDCTYVDTRGQTSTGQCVLSGGRFAYANVCTGRETGVDNICGNGVRSSLEVCEVGDTATVACTTPTGQQGFKLQVCDRCQGYADGRSTVCTPLALCGNGRIDRNVCVPGPGSDGAGVKYGQSCNAPTSGRSTECSDARDADTIIMSCTPISSVPGMGREEVCDDGAENGRYGQCNRTCSGYDGLCGDGLLSPGETCDLGTRNGDYCDARPSSVTGQEACVVAQSCGYDCQSRAPYCGDDIIQTESGEQCEPGGRETTAGKLCYSGPFAGAKACETNADCTQGSAIGQCGTGSTTVNPIYDSCAQVSDYLCAGTGTICSEGDRRICTTDADCAAPGAGGYCLPRAQVKCTQADAQAASPQGCGPLGRCIAHLTQHVRTCSDGSREDAPSMCRWNAWSECKAIGFCGDGVRDAGEACDDGNQDDGDSCTSQCRLPTCGDGYTQRGVEQCDRGGLNGQSCNSEYGLSCQACSAQCTLVPQSGGFCGNGLRDGREQCDFIGACQGGTNNGVQCRNDSVCTGGGTCALPGIDGTETCRSLGYDYALNSTCNTRAYIAHPNGDIACIQGTGVSCALCDLPSPSGPVVPTTQQIAQNCGNLAGQSYTDCYNNLVSFLTPKGYTLAGRCVPCTNGSCQPVLAASNQTVTARNQAACIAGSQRETLTCSNLCSFSGCGVCTGTPPAGTGVSISATLQDSASLQHVPNARITLRYQGNVVQEVFSDTAGRFTLQNLHGRAECGQYRIDVESTRDNPLTTDVVERFGYRPYSSPLFSVGTFSSLLNGGNLELIPRLDEGDTGTSAGSSIQSLETRVYVTWSGSMPVVTQTGSTSNKFVRTLVPHLILPDALAYSKVPSSVVTGLQCRAALRPACSASETPYCTTTETACYNVVNGQRTQTACCPNGSNEAVRTTIRNELRALNPRTEITDSVIDMYISRMCCSAPLVASSQSTYGYETANSCVPTSLSPGITSSITPDYASCRIDIAGGSTWHGPATLSAYPQAQGICAPHLITTAQKCTELQAGSIEQGAGPAGPLTDLACNPRQTCDEYVKTADSSAPMIVRYLRPSSGSGVYDLYLEVRGYYESLLASQRSSLQDPISLLSSRELTAEVLIGTQRLRVTLPQETPSCYNSAEGLAWHVYTQNAATGEVTLRNEWVCNPGSSIRGWSGNLLPSFRPSGFPQPTL